ncbi:transcription termination factor MTEF1, chloroplastic-like isoform X3 [Prosopis cineraria]|uniref:transcription termination factor MTEF1, chloroplastic-like isoform X3 n=1 Tax=Prosopis cineraria TaxID=364024 RepID=UPI00240FEAFE|nr:transcription termination factor MTEF1, chloroplastic-like isoform X3 [Prosopis cineraria]
MQDSRFRYASSTSSNGHSFTVSYLIHACGLSPKQAVSASKRVSFDTRDKPDLVINFLKSHGFSRPQIIGFIKQVPEFLRSDPEKTFLPKIEFFKSRGVPTSHIPRLVCSYPQIMSRSLTKQLIPSFDFFRDVFQSDENLVKTLRYCSGILLDINTRAVPNMQLLRGAGVPESNVIKLLQYFPRALTYSPNQFKSIVERVKEIGINPLKFQFLMAVHVYSSFSKSTLAKKADTYKKWGWSDNDILAAFRRYPFCMTVSEDKLDAALEFLVHNLGCDSSVISTYPIVLAYSLRKRIVPRGAVLQVLLSKGLVKSKTLLATFAYTEKVFLRRLVLCHGQEANELLELYRTKLDQAK